MGLFRRKNTERGAGQTTAPPAVNHASPDDPDDDRAIGDGAVGDGAVDNVANDNRAMDVAALESLRAELSELKVRLDASERTNVGLEATVATLNQRLIVAPPPSTPPPAPAPPPPDPSSNVISATMYRERDVEIDAALELLRRHAAEIDRRMDALDGRVTSVSTELANQVTEIGNDIEPLHQSAERLAAEQARYQIQFRQDLAELAERFRRPGTT